MFRPAFTKTPTFNLMLGLGLCSLGGAMLYAYYKIRDDEENVDGGDAPKEKKSMLRLVKKKEEKEVSLKLVLKVEHIALLIGRDGQNIPLIEEKTNTRIRFRDKDSTHKFCDIDGFAIDVKRARDLIFKEIETYSMQEQEISVPTVIYNKMMARGGEIIQEISRKSLAKISVDRKQSPSSDRKNLIIIGNLQQVNIARKLLEDKIQEEEDLRKAVEESELTREPRRSPTNSVASSLYSSQTSLSSHLAPKDKLISYSNENKSMEIFVSAVASLSKFWIQLVGPQTKKLDSLVKEMTEYYAVEDNRKMHKIKEPYLGQIVAAIYCYDGKWYRAEVVGILPNEAKEGDVILDLYFVDYGDSEYVSACDIYELRTDFLTLRFQAVECFLANVRNPSSDTSIWPLDTIQRFEELTDVACWKKLTARVVTYKERPKAANDSATAGVNREGTTIPGIELYDVCEGVEVNVGTYLISAGLALPLEGSPLEAELKSNSNTPTNSPTQSPTQSPAQSPLPTTSSEEPTELPSSSSVPSNDPQTSAADAHLQSQVEPSNDPQTSAEDAHLQSQVEHLSKKNNNTHANGKISALTKKSTSIPTSSLITKKSNDLLNGNHITEILDTMDAPAKSLNGNLVA